MNIRGLLGRSEFFRGISPRSLASLAAIAVPKKLGKRELLFLEGGEGRGMYLLAEGAVQLSKSAPDGREIVIKTLQPGEVFGEVVVFEARDYPVTAMAVEPGLVLLIPRLQIECLLADEGFRRDFMAMLMAKQRYLTERILSLTSRDVEERFFAFLEERYGRRDSYRILLSKKDVAAAIGTIPETFSRLLQRLRAQHRLSWDGGKLTLAPGFWDDRED
jgi:CRP-like cAMP-binding protein